MAFVIFLQWLLTPAGCAAGVFGAIQVLDRWWPPPGLTGNQKFYGALALSILVPLGAYAGEIALGLFSFSAEGLFEAFFVTYAASQTVHRTASLQAAAAPVLATLESAVTPLWTRPTPEDRARGIPLAGNSNWTASGTGLPPPPIAPVPPGTGGTP